MPAPAHFYVWYRVVGDVAAARAAVDTMMKELARGAGIDGRLLVRRDDPSTWMEIYEDVADAAAFEREMDAAILRHGIARIDGIGDRHVESFVAPE